MRFRIRSRLAVLLIGLAIGLGAGMAVEWYATGQPSGGGWLVVAVPILGIVGVIIGIAKDVLTGSRELQDAAGQTPESHATSFYQQVLQWLPGIRFQSDRYGIPGMGGQEGGLYLGTIGGGGLAARFAIWKYVDQHLSSDKELGHVWRALKQRL